MKQLTTIIFTFLTITAFAQSKNYPYSMLDKSFDLESTDFENQQLNGKIKSVAIYEKVNSNYESSDKTIKLDSALTNARKYFIESNRLVETHIINPNGAIGTIRKFSNGLVRQSLFYGSSKMIQHQDTFLYNHSDQLVKMTSIGKAGSYLAYTTYQYNSDGKLESVNDAGRLSFKYIYDKTGGFYDISYYHKNNKDSICKVRYHRSSDTEVLNIVVQGVQNKAFENVVTWKKLSQELKKMDNRHRVVFEESRDLVSGAVQMEKLYTYQADQLVKSTFKTDYGINDTHFYVYKDDKLISHTSRDKSDTEIFKQELQYNAHGDVIKMHEKSRDKEEIHIYEYKYDQNNNWTIKKDIINGTLFNIKYRDIVYEK